MEFPEHFFTPLSLIIIFFIDDAIEDGCQKEKSLTSLELVRR